MKIKERLTFIKQQYVKLTSICDPKLVSDIRPSKNQRGTYVELIKSIKSNKDIIDEKLNKISFQDGSIQADFPADTLDFFINTISKDINNINRAFKIIDPNSESTFYLIEDLLRDMYIEHRKEKKVYNTFDYSLERLQMIVEDNEDLEGLFSIERSFEIIESKLIKFNPDDWLDNANSLMPIRTSRKGHEIPIHARERLIEIYRSYVFGNWLSVLALSRTVLEYVIFDNLTKLGIDKYYTITNSNEKKIKKLSHLIDDVGERMPNIITQMTTIKDLGNEYIHPKKNNKQQLFSRKENAKECLIHLRDAVEALYLAKKA